MKKHTLHSEAAYVIGLLLIALSVAFIKLTGFGLSMVVAPAYLIHLEVFPHLSFFSFGVSEYLFQGLLVVIMALILKRFKISYLLCFVTAVIYGYTLDGCIAVLSHLPSATLYLKILWFIIGEQLCCIGVALMFRTYITPEAYELVVMETADKWNGNMSRLKWGFDILCCVIAIILSFAFFGKWRFDVIGIGTLVCTAANGFFIAQYSKILEKHFTVKDLLPMRRFFEK